jgi:endonuclease YncB( thermonuclease family)
MKRVSRRRIGQTWTLLTAVLFQLVLGTGAAWADASEPGGTFTDEDGGVFEGAIEAIAADGITLGCNPPGNYLYCVDDSVTRGQMAGFLDRALNLPPSTADLFTDDSGSVFEGAINRLGEAGITRGCNPPADDMFCPDRTLNRGEMAAFMARAFDLNASTHDHFFDDNGNIFEGAINSIAAVGITLGCNPPSNTNFCPGSSITRGQMAAFLTRAPGRGLTPMTPPPPTRVTVLSIIDSDTITVSLDGVNQLVSLIGIEPIATADECFDEATAALAALVTGKTVRIDRDVSDRDSLDQLLRYVFLTDGTFVNAEMVEAGRAAAATFPPDSEFAELFVLLEEQAQATDRGMWDTGGCDMGGGV